MLPDGRVGDDGVFFLSNMMNVLVIKVVFIRYTIWSPSVGSAMRDASNVTHAHTQNTGSSQLRGTCHYYILCSAEQLIHVPKHEE